ncbi:hypothetical protein [Lactobacillus johnsonii]
MEEKEVLKRLGFKEDENLGEVEQLKNYELSYAGDKESPNDYFYLTDKNNIDDLMSAYLKILSTEQPVLPIFYYGRIAGWRAYLNPNSSTDDKKIIKRYEPPYIKIHEKDVQPGSTDELIYVPQPKKDKKGLTSADTRIERGHVLLGCVSFFLPFKSFLKRADYNKYSNLINTIPQFKRANGNNSNSHGQEYFEKIITDHKNLQFFYECEAIFARPTDKVPIGTRIRIVEVERQDKNADPTFVKNSDLSTQVFIPNCDYIKSKDTIDNENSTSEPENTVDDYRTFFKGGDLNSLKWKKADTPKNN